MLIIIYGYYRRRNAGDDQYEETLRAFLEETGDSNPDVVFVTPDDYCRLDDLLPKAQLLIVGGGDVLNKWFLVPLQTVLDKMKTPRPLVISLSTGIPYPSIIEEGYLDCIDRFFLRSKADLPAMRARFGEDFVKFLPDMSMLLAKKKAPVCPKTIVHHVGICLARPIYHPDSPKAYKTILKNLARGLADSEAAKCHNLTFHLIGFNHDSSEKEGDQYINDDFERQLRKAIDGTHHHIVNHRDVDHYRDIYDLIGRMDAIVSMRFHSIWFALLNGIPFLPIFSTRKVFNLLQYDLAYSLGIAMETNEKLVPTGLERGEVTQKFNYLCHSHGLLQEKMSLAVDRLNRVFEDAAPYFRNLIQFPSMFRRFKVSSRPIIEHADRAFSRWMATRRCEILEDWRDHDDMTVEEAEFGASLFLMQLLDVPNPTSSRYHYGLSQKILSCRTTIQLVDELSWVAMDHQDSQQQHNVNKPDFDMPVQRRPMLNMSFMPQRTNGKYHRFGWEYVLDQMDHLNDPNSSLFVDVYVDRTFGWNCQYLMALDILPYKKPWMGFIHHTFLAGYSTNNCFALVKNPTFVESLKTCKGLFVLSRSLKKQLEQALILLGVPSVDVYVLYHPTGFVDQTFDFKRFAAQPEKKLVHVGAWMRDTFSFYALDVSKTPFTKAALLGKDMKGYWDPQVCSERYFYCNVLQTPPKTSPKENGFSRKLMDSLRRLYERLKPRKSMTEMSFQSQLLNSICREPNYPEDCMCRDICRDLWGSLDTSEYKEQLEALIEQVKSREGTVQFIDEVSDTEYDELFTTSIVFLRLFDASAVNTVIECIVRNTPLIVNRLPALVEYLGASYPLFYDDLSQVPQLLDVSTLRDGHDYLARMDKSFLTAPNFLTQFIQILSAITV